MLRRHRGALVAAVSTAMALVTTGCGTSVGSGGGPQGAGAPDTTPDTRVGGQGGTFRLGIVEPVAIDPYNAQESEGILVTSQLFAGLTRVDLNNQTVPYVAESWTSDKACTPLDLQAQGRAEVQQW